jgi:probable rRNA maturation factor
MVLNRQARIAVDLRGVRRFVRRLRSTLKLGGRTFNVCFVDDREMERLNAAYRGKRRPTDVLSFPWSNGRRGPVGAIREWRGFLGEVAISAETARRNARSAGHATANEIRWLLLHGVLHLLGYDHETDRGEMTALELALRERLGIVGGGALGRRSRGRKRHS